MVAELDSLAVENFRKYLKIKTVHPTPDYGEATKFLFEVAHELKLPCKKYEFVPGKPVILMTCLGSNPALSSVLLNSHIDVVPAFKDHWRYDPFEAYMDSNGDIFARGTQDMKSIGIQYIEAMRRFILEGKRFKRTIHLLFVPDEEIGGADGMACFVASNEFNELNVGFSLDEGLPSETDSFKVYYAERSPWWIEVVCPGDPGHGSMFIKNNAAEKLRRVINSFLKFKDSEEKRKELDGLKIGEVTTVNLTMIQGGVQPNVVPNNFKAYFDLRLPPTVDLQKFEEEIRQWIHQAGDGVEMNFLQKSDTQQKTDTSDENIFWKALSSSFAEMDLKVDLEVFPGATDSRYVRKAGIPAIGFSPINRTKQLLHDHNEYLNRETFIRGIDIYYRIIPKLADC